MRVQIFVALALLVVGIAQAEPNLAGKTDRPLRYRPDGTDFVITNGPERFNRPLYIRNSAMRVDAGDRPEFSLFLPGRGGNLRLGIRVGEKSKWLDQAEQIVARYRPAQMIYEIHDPLLGSGSVDVELLTLADADGYIVRVEAKDAPQTAELLFAFGGANGEKGRRNGDIGCESVPVSQFFAFKADHCRDNTLTIDGNHFVLKSKPATLVGAGPEGSTLAIADARKWDSIGELFAASNQKPELAVVTGSAKLANKPLYVVVQKVGEQIDPTKAYEAASKRAKSLREKVIVDTPDAFINAAVAALNVAADGVWDEKQGAVMHGAVAWRVKLLGWRGPYANDALGWHDRAERHLRYWAGQQNTDPVPTTQPGADASANLSRSEAALHSNGDISHSHYDMNLVFIDALFRHLMWTGDLTMARELWPVIQRHIAWEKRLFRREFGPEKLPLYEGYCCIWASDDVWYSGGGATHATAYNYWHNRMAAKLARALGEDPAPYDQEADLIWKAMQQLLWCKETGCFAESKDLLGLQLLHPSAAVWTVYHTIDSQACTPEQAMSMTRYIDHEIARIPIHGPGVPDENLYTIPTTNWMPYTWSTNNVVMAEAAHTSLAYWLAGRPDDAFKLFKGCVLNSMYTGLCPGNAGMCTQFDVARGESQRDFADAVGVCSRAIVEGLFGVKPDLVGGQIVISPGFPATWDHASIRHPDFEFSFGRDGDGTAYLFTPHWNNRVKVHFVMPERKVDQILDAEPNQAVRFRVPDDRVVKLVTDTASANLEMKQRSSAPAHDLEPIDLSPIFNDRVTDIFKHEYLTPRSPFCSLSLPKQGTGSWCHPESTFEISDVGLRRAADQNGGKILLPNNIPLQTPGSGDAKNIAFVSQWDNFPRQIEIALAGKSSCAYLMMAGTTNSMQSQFDNGQVVVTYADGTTDTLALRNPTNWWPIEQDYLIDDFGFKREGPLPIRIDLATGKLRVLDMNSFKGQGGKIRAGAATVLVMPLDPSKPLKSLTVKALANDVVIGLMSLTLGRN